VNFGYDKKLRALHDQVNRWVKDVLLDGARGLGNTRVQPLKKSSVRSRSNEPVSPSPRGQSAESSQSDQITGKDGSASLLRRVLLVDVVRLCAFFGHESMDVLLQHLLTFLNDPVCPSVLSMSI
jgi:hypothetical protein